MAKRHGETAAGAAADGTAGDAAASDAAAQDVATGGAPTGEVAVAGVPVEGGPVEGGPDGAGSGSAAPAGSGAGLPVAAAEADDGPVADEAAGGPERMCLVTRAVLPVEALVRFVVDPDGHVVPDLKRSLPGRGVWVTATREAVATAERKRLFGRGFKAEVKVEPGLADRVEALMRRAALQSLSLARKAGLVVTGFTKVEAAIGGERLSALVEASDGAEDGKRKVIAAVMRRFGDAGAVPVVAAFDSAEIGLALGLTNVIHAAVLAGRAGDGFVDRAGALARFRGSDVTHSAVSTVAGS